jgi:hypothetical protein
MMNFNVTWKRSAGYPAVRPVAALVQRPPVDIRARHYCAQHITTNEECLASSALAKSRGPVPYFARYPYPP